jgi:hypothetical protein
MNVQERLDMRWQGEVQKLSELSKFSQHRLIISTATITRVQMEIDCISAFHHGTLREAPEIRKARHRILLLRSEAWPAEPVIAIHQGPPGIWHPNILGGLDAPLSENRIVAMQQIAGEMSPGKICYGGPSSGFRLVDIVHQIYNMIGYRFPNSYARRDEHFNLPALNWVNEMLRSDPAFFPLEKRPLVPHLESSYA